MRKEITEIRYDNNKMGFRSASYYLDNAGGGPTFILEVLDPLGKPDPFQVDTVTVKTSQGETAELRIAEDFSSKDKVRYLVAGEPTFS